jgi:hypothetical protein
MLRKLLLLLALIPVLSLTVPASIQVQNLNGTYQAEGVGPNGRKYRGIVEIIKHDQTYRLKWTVAPDGVYFGIGILKGDELAVSYLGQVLGVVLYKIEKGPRLVGDWTVVGADGQVYSETLTKMSLRATTPPQPKHDSRPTTLASNLLR